ncbi:phage tail assembly chaperone G [Virgibacillus kimchii]
MANLKRHMIELVKEVKEGEIVTEKYITPVFVPLKTVYEAIDLMGELNNQKMTPELEKGIIDEMLDFVVKAYGDQFTKDELFNGLHAPDAISVLQDQIMFIARGYQNSDTKKYLANKS